MDNTNVTDIKIKKSLYNSYYYQKNAQTIGIKQQIRVANKKKTNTFEKQKNIIFNNNFVHIPKIIEPKIIKRHKIKKAKKIIYTDPIKFEDISFVLKII